MRVAAASAVVLLAVSGCSFGDDEPEEVSVNADFVVELVRRETGRAAGQVGLNEQPGGKTRVEIVLRESGTGLQAEIRGGNCDSQNIGVSYSFPPLVDGRLQRVVDVPLPDLRRAGYLVLVHDPGGDGAVCGDLARSQPPDAAPTYE